VNDYNALAARWKALRSRGTMVREVACVGAARTLLCAERGDYRAPLIALSAGVHGDEPAGPWALLALCEQDDLDERFAYRIWPCMNPSGFALGTRENVDGVDVNRFFGRGGQTPESRAVVTANRDRKYPLSIDLHEDGDALGFYCYEYGGDDVARAAVEAVRAANFPIQDDAHVREGIVRPQPDEEIVAIGGVSYTLLIVRHAARQALTFETPGCLPLDERILIHRIAVKAAISALSKQPDHA
jgi:murein peptide amidase A